jgi:hypothetical protein
LAWCRIKYNPTSAVKTGVEPGSTSKRSSVSGYARGEGTKKINPDFFLRREKMNSFWRTAQQHAQCSTRDSPPPLYGPTKTGDLLKR